jgi:two-component system sensor histidine kinase PhoQ
VAEDLTGYAAQVASFRHSLWLWLGGAVVVLLAVQAAVLHWSLAPLRQVSDDIAAVERGQAQQLSGDYPKELSGLTRNINAFIANERRQIERHRNTLGDLAHSLKTPLAVVRGMVETARDIDRDELATQANRMSEIVEYQLRRAAAAGQRTLTQPVSVAANVDKLVNSLRKVYAVKPLAVEQNVPPDLHFYGDRGDLLEVLGNLLDNAFKWGRQTITLSAEALDAEPGRRHGLRLVVADDGPGIDAAMREQVMDRGVRLDGRIEGQGLGLAAVRDIVEAYGGRLSIASEPGCGAEIVVEFSAS